MGARQPRILKVTDPGDTNALQISSQHHMTYALSTAGAETRTLATPKFAGQRCELSMDVDGGDCVLTVASFVDQAGNNTLTFADAGDLITLRGATKGAGFVWRIADVDGVGLTIV